MTDPRSSPGMCACPCCSRIDWRADQDMDAVAGKALTLIGRIHDEDPRELHRHLQDLCLRHPVKAVQLMCTLLAWHDPNTSTETLVGRAVNASRSALMAVPLTRRKAV